MEGMAKEASGSFLDLTKLISLSKQHVRLGNDDLSRSAMVEKCSLNFDAICFGSPIINAPLLKVITCLLLFDEPVKYF